MQKYKVYSIFILILIATACDFIPALKNDERIPVAKVYEQRFAGASQVDSEEPEVLRIASQFK